MSNEREPADWLAAVVLVSLLPWPIAVVLGFFLRRWLRPRGLAERIAYWACWILLTWLSWR